MRALLLQDQIYPVNQVTGKVGSFVRHLSNSTVRYPAGMMVDVAPDQRLVINGEKTEHRLSQDALQWTKLYTQKELDSEMQPLELELAAALESRQAMEDRARDAEHEVREHKQSMLQLQDELVALHGKVRELNERILATQTGMFVLEVSNSGMGVFAGAKAGSQANQKDSQGTRTNHT